MNISTSFPPHPPKKSSLEVEENCNTTHQTELIVFAEAFEDMKNHSEIEIQKLKTEMDTHPSKEINEKN